ncbi:hypothetical protein [Paenilisteria rocourtiae]|uniref:Uncharacterized protein n=1 Tax=Listeria rocourtiae TaxID=647910 RepID=A0A4R6ZSG8_9LIST|nr:hypothetical protein [Listeria rocourtiae]TDR55089.1 hypothetical protein DFP96_10115 [Listeria rocourtiae]
MSEYEQAIEEMRVRLTKLAKIETLIEAQTYKGDALTFYAHVVAIVNGKDDE